MEQNANMLRISQVVNGCAASRPSWRSARSGSGGLAAIMKMSVAVIAIAACFAKTVAVDAAEIRSPISSLRDTAVLEGKIEAGDLAKLRTFILEGNGAFTGAYTIFLASPGGDLAEAIKIGRFIRELQLATNIPPASTDERVRKFTAVRYSLKDPKANYMCASACFFVFVAGIYRSDHEIHGFNRPSSLGIHRPYLSESDLKALTSDQAIAATSATRTTVENYLKEMGVPAKYADQMFSITKQQIRWISDNDFEADFAGFIPELKDWVDARCDKRTDIEKQVWEEMKTKSVSTAAQKAMLEKLMDKFSEQTQCEIDTKDELARKAFVKMYRSITPK
jgi:hypothetical protein